MIKEKFKFNNALLLTSTLSLDVCITEKMCTRRNCIASKKDNQENGVENGAMHYDSVRYIEIEFNINLC